jgi:hypothetical protein
MRAARRSTGALTCIAVLALAGCGSSGSSSATLTHAQLVSRADALCKATNAQLASLPVPGSLKSLAGYATSTLSATDRLHKDLAALHPSAADAAPVTRYLTALAQGDQILDQISTAAADGDSSTVRTLGRKLSAINAGPLAVAAGLSACATPA